MLYYPQTVEEKEDSMNTEQKEKQDFLVALFGTQMAKVIIKRDKTKSR